MRLLPLALTLSASLLVACPDRTRGPDDPQDDDDDSAGEGEVRTWYRDDDGDGWGREGNIAETVEQPAGFVDRFGDCDDLDAAVHPEAEEICDERDNDCDELVDEDLDDLELFADDDGDSYGDDGDALLSCDPVDGYVQQGGDCDDGEASVHPGAQELCNDRDDDCDGSADADHPDATDWYADLDGDGYGDPADATSACAQPGGRLADDQDCDDSDATIHPGADEVCDDGIDQNCDGLADDGCTVVHCGDITADETWTAGVIHVVTCDVFVDDPTDPTLTVQDGAIVRFAAGAELFTGYDDPGRLVVDGSSSGVLFTPHVSVALPGSWPGVSLWNQDSGSILTGLTVEYGGDNGQGNIRVNDAEPILDGVLSRYSSEAGLQANLGSLTITNSSFVDNDGAGLDLFGPVLLAGFDGNTLAGNTEPIVLGAAALGALDSTNTYVGNFYDRVRVLGGDVQDSALWTDPGVPVLVQGDVYVGGMPPITLELGDGLEVLFETGRALRIGSGGDAELLVSGGTSGVLFTSADATPAPGDWRGLMFSGGTLPSTLSGLTLEYAGHSGTSTILLDGSVGAQVTLSEVTSRSGAAWGLEVQNGSVSVAASAFEDHALGGVLVGSAGELAVGSGARSFIGNTITGSSREPRLPGAPSHRTGLVDRTSGSSG
jgi:hypothetical protein